MTGPPDTPRGNGDADERALLALLAEQHPTPGPALRRHVRQRIELSLARQALRRRAAVLLSSGTLALSLGVVLAVIGPG
jgi:dTDP-4-amino-4,6-dideoxygalactose transaminase